MSPITPYVRYEVLRVIRNRRFFVFSLVIPLVFFFILAGPNRGDDDFLGSGIPAPLYYMVGLAAFGTMIAMLGCGARIASERDAGWNRQLRISPLTPRNYFQAKILTSYLMAGIAIVLLYASGIALGVSLPISRWLEMTGLILVALIPFGAMGVLIGHLMKADSIGPLMGGGTSIFAFLGGTWFPIPDSGLMHDVAVCLPSYWLVQAGHVGIGGSAWGVWGWVVIAAWTAVCTLAAMRAYWRDTDRV